MIGPRPDEDVLDIAVQALTEAARRTISCTDPDGREHQRHADFAETVSHTVAGAAANLGGIGAALAGRPPSRKADCVRRLLRSMVGDERAYLLEHRTEPVTVMVAVDNVLNDLGVLQLYEEAEDELVRRANAIRPTAKPRTRASTTQKAPVEQQTILDQLDQLRLELDAMRQHDWVSYGEAFKANVHTVAGKLLPNLPVPVEVDVRLDRQTASDQSKPSHGPALILWERARDMTPLPGSGIPLKDYPFEPSFAEIERAAGRDPLHRLAQEPHRKPAVDQRASR